jgi:hypothetical protein
MVKKFLALVVLVIALFCNKSFCEQVTLIYPIDSIAVDNGCNNGNACYETMDWDFSWSLSWRPDTSKVWWVTNQLIAWRDNANDTLVFQPYCGYIGQYTYHAPYPLVDESEWTGWHWKIYLKWGYSYIFRCTDWDENGCIRWEPVREYQMGDSMHVEILDSMWSDVGDFKVEPINTDCPAGPIIRCRGGMDFGPLQVGQGASDWSFISNDGCVDNLIIYNYYLSGSWLFNVSIDRDTIYPNSYASMLIHFYGGNPGAYSATAYIHSNDTVNPIKTINLFAYVLTPQEPRISAPLEIVFDSISVDSLIPDTVTITVGNSGTASLNISNIYLYDYNYPQVFSLRPFSLPIYIGAGDTMDLGVIFNPGDTGLFEGNIAIQSNDVHSPITNIFLSGRCFPPPATFHLASVVPVRDDTSFIMQGGALFRYYQVSDTAEPHNPICDVMLITTTGDTIISDSLGIIALPVNVETMGWTIPYSIHDWNYFSGAQLLGRPVILDTIPIFFVKILPREYTKEWDLLATCTASGGIGVGGGVGPLGIRAARLSIKGSKGVGETISARKSTVESDFLIYSRRFESSVGAALDIGRIPALSVANVRVGAGAGGVIQGQSYQSFSFNNPYADSIQVAAQAALFLETESSVGAGVFSPIIGPVLNGLVRFVLDNGGYLNLVNQSEDERGWSLGLEDAIDAGCKTQLNNSSLNKTIGIELPNAQAAASITGTISTYRHSIYGDNHPGSDIALSMTEVAGFDISLIKARILQGSPNAFGWVDQLMPHPNCHWGGEITHAVEFDDELHPVKASMLITQDDRELNANPEVIHNFESMEYNLDLNILPHIADATSSLGRLLTQHSNPNGLPLSAGTEAISEDFGSTAAKIINITDSLQNIQIKYDRTRTESRVFDYSLKIPVDIGLGPQMSFDFGGKLTFTDSRTYDLEKGVIKKFAVPVFALERYQDDSYLQDDQTTLQNITNTILPAAFWVARSSINAFWNRFWASIDHVRNTIVQTGENIIRGGAQLIIRTGTYANGLKAQVVKFLPGFLRTGGYPRYYPYQTFATGGLLLTDSSVVVTAIGSAYDIKILDQSDMPLDTFLYSMDLKIVVTDSEIVASGFSPSDRPNLKIYYWHPTRYKSIQLASTISGDTILSTVENPGQYFAGLYGAPIDITPPTIDSTYPRHGSVIYDTTSVLGAYVTDTIGISSGINPSNGYFILDGDSILGSIQLMNRFEGWMYMEIQDTILIGNHYLIVRIGDMAGNETISDTIFFTVLGSLCHYKLGDINSDGRRIGGDVTYGVRYFKSIGPPPPDSCFMDSTNSYLYVAGDVNGNCEFRGSDITRLVAHFKGIASLSYCHFFPPPPYREGHRMISPND